MVLRKEKEATFSSLSNFPGAKLRQVKENTEF